MRLGRLQQSTHNTAASDLWNDIRIGNVAETIRVIGLGDVATVLDPTCGVPRKHPVQLGNKQGALVLSDLCFDMCKIGIGNLNAGPPRVMKRAFIVLFVRYALSRWTSSWSVANLMFASGILAPRKNCSTSSARSVR